VCGTPTPPLNQSQVVVTTKPLLVAVNHTSPATNATTQILVQAFEATPETASVHMDEIRQVQAVGDTFPLVDMDARGSKIDQFRWPCHRDAWPPCPS